VCSLQAAAGLVKPSKKKVTSLKNFFFLKQNVTEGAAGIVIKVAD